jgi:hypothetical protein
MDEEPWHVWRLRELEAAAPVKHKEVKPFVKLPIEWAFAFGQATRSPELIICAELLLRYWKTKSRTFSLPNDKLKGLGVSREAKRRVLHELERGGLIMVERPNRKTPIIALLL